MGDYIRAIFCDYCGPGVPADAKWTDRPVCNECLQYELERMDRERYEYDEDDHDDA